MTGLLPKSLFVPKKLGLQPKSASPPMIPAPIPPALTPRVAWPFWMLLPNADPTHGVTNPSARACIGASTTAAAEARMERFDNSFHSVALSLVSLQATYLGRTAEVSVEQHAPNNSSSPREA